MSRDIFNEELRTLNLKKTLQNKIFIIYIVISFTLLLAHTTFSLYRFYRYRCKLTNLTCNYISSSVSSNLSNFFTNINKTSLLTANNPALRKALKKIKKNPNDLESYHLVSLHSELSTTSSDNFSLIFYDENGKLLYGSNYYSYKNLFDDYFIRSNKNKIDKFKKNIFSSFQQNYDLITLNNKISLIKPIPNIKGTIDGYIVVLADESSIDQIIESNYSFLFNKKNNYQLKIYDDNNNLIFSNKNIFFYQKKKINYFISTISATKWKVEVSIEKKVIYKELIKEFYMQLLILAFIFSVILFFINIKIKKEFKPIKDLVFSIEQVKKRNYSYLVKNDNDYYDLSILFTGYNGMLEEIEYLINTVHKDQLKLEKLKLEVLKLQINPHFLYNSLQTIEAFGEINDIKEVSDMSYWLGNLLRYNLKESNIVTLEEEVTIINYYMSIEKIRYNNNISFSINLPEEVKKIKLPKFILQPLFENCIIHGYTEDRTLIVNLNTLIFEEYLLIIIRDNGNGISEEDLKEINKKIFEEKDFFNLKNIGIANVHQRINIKYGKEFGVTINSKQNKGTIITIKLPIIN